MPKAFLQLKDQPQRRQSAPLETDRHQLQWAHALAVVAAQRLAAKSVRRYIRRRDFIEVIDFWVTTPKMKSLLSDKGHTALCFEKCTCSGAKNRPTFKFPKTPKLRAKFKFV